MMSDVSSSASAGSSMTIDSVMEDEGPGNVLRRGVATRRARVGDLSPRRRVGAPILIGFVVIARLRHVGVVATEIPHYPVARAPPSSSSCPSWRGGDYGFQKEWSEGESISSRSCKTSRTIK